MQCQWIEGVLVGVRKKKGLPELELGFATSVGEWSTALNVLSSSWSIASTTGLSSVAAERGRGSSRVRIGVGWSRGLADLSLDCVALPGAASGVRPSFRPLFGADAFLGGHCL